LHASPARFYTVRTRYGALDGIDHWDFIVGARSGSPRTEMMYNFDPYILWTNDEDE